MSIQPNGSAHNRAFPRRVVAGKTEFSTRLGKSQYPESVSALDFRDATTPRFAHGYEVFYLFIETRFSHLLVSLDQNNLYSMSKLKLVL